MIIKATSTMVSAAMQTPAIFRFALMSVSNLATRRGGPRVGSALYFAGGELFIASSAIQPTEVCTDVVKYGVLLTTGVVTRDGSFRTAMEGDVLGSCPIRSGRVDVSGNRKGPAVFRNLLDYCAENE